MLPTNAKKKTKVIFISDLHAAVSLPYANISGDNTTSDRLRDVCGVFQQVKKVCVSYPVSVVFILGDLFDERNPDPATLKAVCREIKSILEVSKVVILPGNHDAHCQTGGLYTLSFLKELQIPGLTIIEEPTLIEVAGFNYQCIPWVSRTHFDKIVPEGDEDTFLLFHQTVAGAVDGAYVAKNGVNESDFDSYAYCLSGHIHQIQYFRNGQYLGSPLHLRFSDAKNPQERGFWLFDSRTYKRRRKISAALRIVPVNAPRFRVLEVNNKKDYKKIDGFLEGRDDYLRFDVTGTTKFIQETVDLLSSPEIGKKRLLHRVVKIRKFCTEMRETKDIERKGTTRDMLTRYIEANDPNKGFEKHVPVGAIHAIGMSIIQQMPFDASTLITKKGGE